MYNNKKKIFDIKYGIKNESRLFPVIKKFFNDNKLIKTDKWCKYDYVSNENIIELKTRRNVKKRQYDTTILNYTKYKYFKKQKKDCYFLIDFDDGLYYWNINDDDDIIINNFTRKDRGINETNKYIFVPNKKLRKISSRLVQSHQLFERAEIFLNC
tara:strand:- start:2937 stop:3404 length:468 start_codon:yes stop_codon:yes gene_type:complete